MSQLSASSSSASSFDLIEIFAAHQPGTSRKKVERALHCGRSETHPHSYAFALASRNPAPQIRARRAAASCKNTHTTTEEEERASRRVSFLFALQCLPALSQQQHQGRAITHSSHTHILTPRSHPTTTSTTDLEARMAGPIRLLAALLVVTAVAVAGMYICM